MNVLTSTTPLPARPATTPIDGPTVWTGQELGTLAIRAERTRNGATTHYRGSQDLIVRDVVRADGVTSVADSISAARDISRDTNTPVAVLQATDGQLYTALVRTRVNAMNPPFLQMRGAYGTLRTEAFDYALRTDLPAGYHDHVATVTTADTALGRALRAIVTDRSVTQTA